MALDVISLPNKFLTNTLQSGEIVFPAFESNLPKRFEKQFMQLCLAWPEFIRQLDSRQQKGGTES
jgi:hypothetical protein